MTSTLKTEKIQFRGDNSDVILLGSEKMGIGPNPVLHQRLNIQSSTEAGIQLQNNTSGTANSTDGGRVSYYEDDLYLTNYEAAGKQLFYVGNNGSTKAMEIHSGGEVVHPARPRFGIYRKPSGTGAEQIINASNTASVSTVVGFDSGGVDENVGSHFDLANSKFTAPVSGLYRFDADILTGLTVPSSGVNWLIYFFSIGGGNGRATGSPYKYIECYNSSGSSSAGESVGDYSFQTPHVGGAMYLTANQYVQLRVYCSNSVNLRIHSGIYSFWRGYLVG